jgi:hypothetical protein
LQCGQTGARARIVLEAVKSVTLPGDHDVKRLVIFVLTNFAYRHTQFVRARWWSQRRFYLEPRTKFVFDPAGIIDAGYNCIAEIFLVLDEAEN